MRLKGNYSYTHGSKTQRQRSLGSTSHPPAAEARIATNRQQYKTAGSLL
jgi:hypothetical protein